MEIYRSYAAPLKCKKSLCPIQKLSSSCQQRQKNGIHARYQFYSGTKLWPVAQKNGATEH